MLLSLAHYFMLKLAHKVFEWLVPASSSSIDSTWRVLTASSVAWPLACFVFLSNNLCVYRYHVHSFNLHEMLICVLPYHETT